MAPASVLNPSRFADALAYATTLHADTRPRIGARDDRRWSTRSRAKSGRCSGWSAPEGPKAATTNETKTLMPRWMSPCGYTRKTKYAGAPLDESPLIEAVTATRGLPRIGAIVTPDFPHKTT